MDFNKVWVTILATAAVVEAWALVNSKPDDTLSERTRAWFHIHKRPGWMVFAAAWVVFSVWFFVHILW